MNLPGLSNMKLVKNTDSANQFIKIGNVRVNINPDIILFSSKNGKTTVGAIKLHLSKSNTLEEDGMTYVSTLMHKYLEISYANDPTIKVDNALCISIDIFNQKYMTSPKSYKNKFKSVEAGCKQYELMWNDSVARNR